MGVSGGRGKETLRRTARGRVKSLKMLAGLML
jgi:hypothetical protein